MNLNPSEFRELFIPGHYLEPEKAGVKHILFSLEWDKPLITALIDDKPRHIKIWEGSTEVLMEILEA